MAAGRWQVVAVADHMAIFSDIALVFPQEVLGHAENPKPMRSAEVMGGIGQWLSGIPNFFPPLLCMISFQDKLRSGVVSMQWL